MSCKLRLANGVKHGVRPNALAFCINVGDEESKFCNIDTGDLYHKDITIVTDDSSDARVVSSNAPNCN